MGAALVTCAVFAAPAHAATWSVAVQAVSARGNPIAGEDPVLQASASLPAGQGEVDGAWLSWSGGSDRCPSRVFFSASAAPKAVRFPGPLAHSKGSILLQTAGGDRRVAATILHGVRRRDFFEGATIAQFRLPPDLIPAYPRRTIYVLAGPIPSFGQCPDAPLRRAVRLGRSAVRGATVTIPATYVAPPPPNPPKPVDLAAGAGLTLREPVPPSEGREIIGDPDLAALLSPSEVAAAGDVNGDGLADAAVSIPYGGPRHAGVATVVFGRPGGGTLQLGSIGSAGFRITGPVPNGYALPVAGIGDLDGDGLGDFVVGAPSAGRGAGAAYVIRGAASNAAIDLAKPGDRLLFKIAGGHPCRRPMPNEGGGDNIGGEVAGPGDMNGDGLPDIAVLADGNCAANGRSAVYVVFGARDGRPVDVHHLGRRGIAVPGDYPAQLSNASIEGAGDVNADGLADLALARGESGSDVTLAAVLLGRRGGGTLRQSQLAFPIKGDSCSACRMAGAAGDVNGDGIGDLLVGGGSEQCREGLGQAYVIFGSRAPHAVNASSLGNEGITVRGLRSTRLFGTAVAAGDVNGDGLADIAVADEDATALGRDLAGEVFLVPGRREPGTIDLRYAGTSVTAWAGPDEEAHVGISLAGLGDFDGDGRPDLVAGALMDADPARAAFVLPVP